MNAKQVFRKTGQLASYEYPKQRFFSCSFKKFIKPKRENKNNLALPFILAIQMAVL